MQSILTVAVGRSTHALAISMHCFRHRLRLRRELTLCLSLLGRPSRFKISSSSAMFVGNCLSSVSLEEQRSFPTLCSWSTFRGTVSPMFIAQPAIPYCSNSSFVSDSTCTSAFSRQANEALCLIAKSWHLPFLHLSYHLLSYSEGSRLNQTESLSTVKRIKGREYA